MLVVGSQALKKTGEEYLSSAKRQWDWDFICTYDEYLSFKQKLGKVLSYPTNRGKVMILRTKDQNYEFEIAWENSTAAELLQLVNSNPSLVEEKEGMLWAKPNLIFALKKSHRYLKDSPHFIKTMLDYKHMLSKGCQIPDVLSDWYQKRVKDTYWYNHPNLDVSKKDFFKGDGVPYIVIHDDIHESVKRFDKPAYLYYMKDGAEVKSDKNKFLNCSREIRLAGVVEEAAVLAIERSLLPIPGGWSPKQAWSFALMKVCTSITSGWFREFAYDNYFEILSLYPEGFWEKFQNDLSSGLVRYVDAG